MPLWQTQIPCGSGLAREGGVSVAACVTALPLSQASQLPHLIFVDLSVVFAWLTRIGVSPSDIEYCIQCESHHVEGSSRLAFWRSSFQTSLASR